MQVSKRGLSSVISIPNLKDADTKGDPHVVFMSPGGRPTLLQASRGRLFLTGSVTHGELVESYPEILLEVS